MLRSTILCTYIADCESLIRDQSIYFLCSVLELYIINNSLDLLVTRCIRHSVQSQAKDNGGNGSLDEIFSVVQAIISWF